MRFKTHIINAIQYIEDLDYLKDYAQNIQEIETLDDAATRTKYLVNEMCKYEGIEIMYPFLPHDEIWEMCARVEVKNNLQYEPRKQRELQI